MTMLSLKSICLDFIVDNRVPTKRLPLPLTRAVEGHKREKIFSGNFHYVQCGLSNGMRHDVAEATISITPGGQEGEDWLFSFRSHIFCGARCFYCNPVTTTRLQQFTVKEGEPVQFFSPFVECERRLASVFPGVVMNLSVEVNDDMTGVLRWRGGDERGEFSCLWYFDFVDGIEITNRRMVHRGGYTTKGWGRIKNFTDVAIECEIGADDAYVDTDRMNRENQQILLASMPDISEINCMFLVDDGSFDLEENDSDSFVSVVLEDMFIPIPVQN